MVPDAVWWRIQPGGRCTSLQVDDLEFEQSLGAGDRGGGVALLALRGPGLEALLIGPARDHEVAPLPRDRTQQFEAFDTGGFVPGVVAVSEALLELGVLPVGDGQLVDLHDSHGFLHSSRRGPSIVPHRSRARRTIGPRGQRRSPAPTESRGRATAGVCRWPHGGEPTAPERREGPTVTVRPSSAGAPSGTRTPDLLIKSQPL